MSNTPHLTVYIGMIYAEQVISVIDVLTRVKFSRFLLKGAKYFSPYVVSYLTRQRYEKYRDASGYCMVSAFSLWSVINECNFTKRIWRTYSLGKNMLILGSSLRGVLHSVSLQSDESWIVCMGFTMNLSRWYWFILFECKWMQEMLFWRYAGKLVPLRLFLWQRVIGSVAQLDRATAF